MRALGEPTLTSNAAPSGAIFFCWPNVLPCPKIRQPDNEPTEIFLFYNDFSKFTVSLSKPKNNEQALKPLQSSRRTDRPERLHSSHKTASRPPWVTCAATIWLANGAMLPWAWGSAHSGGKRALLIFSAEDNDHQRKCLTGKDLSQFSLSLSKPQDNEFCPFPSLDGLV